MLNSVGKRSTLLLNKLVSALNKVLDNKDSYRRPQLKIDDSMADSRLVGTGYTAGGYGRAMDLQRRTGERKFWKCYFNAVTCF